jgi:hypothetical protein
VRRGEGCAVVLVDVDLYVLADFGWRAFDDVGDNEGPSFGSCPDGRVLAKKQFAFPDAAGDAIDDRLRTCRSGDCASVGRLVRPLRVDRVECRGVEEDRGSPSGERLNVEHGCGRGGRAVRVRDGGVSRGQRHALVPFDRVWEGGRLGIHPRSSFRGVFSFTTSWWLGPLTT